jgi:hypothetical protein
MFMLDFLSHLARVRLQRGQIILFGSLFIFLLFSATTKAPTFPQVLRLGGFSMKN